MQMSQCETVTTTSLYFGVCMLPLRRSLTVGAHEDCPDNCLSAPLNKRNEDFIKFLLKIKLLLQVKIFWIVSRFCSRIADVSLRSANVLYRK